MRLWDDRLWYVKVGALAAALLVAGRYANEYGPTASPSLAWVLREPGRFDGHEVWVPGARLERGGEGVWISVGEHRVRAAGVALGVPVGSVTLRGRFRAEEGGRIEVLEIRRQDPKGRLPYIRYAVSAAVLLGWFLFLFRPAFRLTRGSPAILETRG